jgi:UDP-N-acetyl-2-amino-2-deoxyglucuronate dehydrogenase
MKGTFGWGIVGCGVIAPTHMSAINATPDAELVAVCDIVDEVAEKFAAENGGVPFYKHYQDMFERDDLDVVSICTPSGIHAEVGIAAAQAGKHILCEKPLDVTLDHMDALIEAADKAGVKLACVFQMRTYPNARRIREAIAEGQLGRMVLGDAYCKYYRSPEYYKSAGWRGTWELDGGGALMNQGVHGIDLLLWLMGSPVKAVTARADHLVREIEVEDTAVALLEYENGAFGVIEGATSVYPGYSTRTELHGELGTIILEDQAIKTWKIIGIEGDLAADQGPVEQQGTASDPKALTATGHTFQVQDLIAAIREDRDPYVTGRSARKAVELILAIYKSAKERKTVELPL